MPLPVAYQNQFKSVHVRGYWLPDSPNKTRHPESPRSGLSGISGYLEELKKNIKLIDGFFSMRCGLRSLTDRYADFRDDTLSVEELTTLASITSPSMHHQKAWSFLLTRTVLGEILQQDPKTLEIDRVGKPRLESARSVILGKGDEEARDRGPLCCKVTGSAHSNSEHRNPNITNGSSVCGASHLAEDDRSNGSMYPTLHFNISHSDNLWIIAWSFKQEVGIDVQKIDTQVNYQGIMRQFFTSSERAKVNTVFDFFDAWTQKEAVLKLRGLNFAHMSKISIDSATLISLDIGSDFKGNLAIIA
jgi:phosphopantetheinyl transferase